MKRNIIKIDKDKCIGCGLCTKACHQGAIELVDGKAQLIKEDYCDGLGKCLPACPTDAITLVERDVPEFKRKAETVPSTLKCGCPSTQSRELKRETASVVVESNDSELMQWPVQIKLIPPNAPYFENANLLISADCAAYAYMDFHRRFIKNHITIIGCPKLDEGDYTEKLTEIISNNNIKSLTIVRMQVPCCSGLENAAKTALKNSGKFIPWQVKIISPKGEIIE